ncbi:Acetyltransferase (GNAT) domain protein [anaerobic digester metagenome]|jgi:ribosomal protein S18 acetylase RimI-like enzyme|uniref:GNAT family N-acetyltransferase n=1 Tax=Oscillibacter ruminantium TaxID=1263547 RepID=UPI002B1F7D48|nr:GNAT family N-acetyltransferase [Oscillibacter ruminantium]MEA5042447.1 GNAT family N-acetyltransferase [Oscillibacter ruminantium]
MNIRTATMADLSALTAVEAACFPVAEAATEADFAARLRVYPNHFWLLEQDGEVVSFVNGMVTDEPTIRDEMYANASLHREDGAWQAIFGVNTLPDYRRRGLAGQLLTAAAEDARTAGRRGCILTCKDRLIHYYEKFGYQNQGVSQSVHGGAVWYDMTLEF